MRDRYLELIDLIASDTLKGKIRSKQQVYKMLQQNVSRGTGEIFELCLQERVAELQSQIETEKDELKQAKAARLLRALQTIEGEWKRQQQENRALTVVETAAQKIAAANPEDRFYLLVREIDPNKSQPLNIERLQQLGQTLVKMPQADVQLQQLANGIASGITSWQELEVHLVSWIYDGARGQLGFENASEQKGPWSLWAKNVSATFPRQVFNALSLNQSVAELSRHQKEASWRDWSALAILLQYLQQGLASWFEKQLYDTKWGIKQANATFLTFAFILSMRKGIRVYCSFI